jgi:hypothetical protein
MTTVTRRILAIVFAILTTNATGRPAIALLADSCGVTITSPQPGEMVGRQRLVSGNATVPASGHLWLFAHIRGLAGWWPQGGGEAELDGDRWDVTTLFGQEPDIGAQFEVIGLIVDDDTHQELEKYVERASKTNYWPPRKLPNVVQGCSVAKVTVTKTSH